MCSSFSRYIAPPPPLRRHNTIIHPMLTRRVHSYISNLFRYSLIYFHPVEKNSTRTAVVVVPNTLWWNAPMFCHLWCRTNPALMRTSTNNPLFSSSCTNWPIDVHPTWSKETIFEVLHIVPLDLQFRHMQQHLRWHVNILHTHIHQRHLQQQLWKMMMIDDDGDNNDNIKPLIWNARTCKLCVNNVSLYISWYWLKFHTQ